MPVVGRIRSNEIEVAGEKWHEALPAVDEVDFQARPVVEQVQNVLVNTFTQPGGAVKNVLAHVRAYDVGMRLGFKFAQDIGRIQGLQQGFAAGGLHGQQQLLPMAKLHLLDPSRFGRCQNG